MVKKVKKKRIRILPCVILILVLYFFYLAGKTFYNLPVKNIFIYGNELLNDQEIIDLAKLSDYPKYYSFSKKDIEKKLLKNEYIEKVTVKRSFFHKIEIYITEYKILLYDNQSEQYILSNGDKTSSDKYASRGYPTLMNYVPDEIYKKFIQQLNNLDDNIINQISEIKYDPSKYDDGRFLLSMNDGNYVYTNVSRAQDSPTSNFELLNLYNDIYPNFDGHIGILYLDSGYGEASEYKIIK